MASQAKQAKSYFGSAFWRETGAASSRMRFFRSVGFVALLLSIDAAVLSASSQARPSTEILEIVRQHLHSAGIPGAQINIASSRGTELSAAIGDCRRGVEMSVARPMLIGSLSKPLTGTVAARLSKAGKLDLDAPVTKVLPELRHLGRVSLRKLLEHRSGFSRRQGMSSPAPVGRAWADLQPAGPSGTFEYSNLNYVILGQAIERASGMTFQSALEAEIPELGQKRSRTDNAPGKCGHRMVFGKMLPWSEEFWPDYLVPAGFVATTADGLGRFQSRLLRQWKIGGNPADEMVGWRSGDWNGERIYWHGGQTRSFRGTMVLMTERDLGFTILTNSAGHAVQDPVDELSKALIAHFRKEQVSAPALPLENYGRAVLLVLLLVQLVRTARPFGILLRNRSLIPIERLERIKAIAYISIAALVTFGVPAVFGMSWFGLFGFAPDLALLLLLAPLLDVIRKLAGLGNGATASSPPDAQGRVGT